MEWIYFEMANWIIENDSILIIYEKLLWFWGWADEKEIILFCVCASVYFVEIYACVCYFTKSIKVIFVIYWKKNWIQVDWSKRERNETTANPTNFNTNRIKALIFQYRPNMANISMWNGQIFERKSENNGDTRVHDTYGLLITTIWFTCVKQ